MNKYTLTKEQMQFLFDSLSEIPAKYSRNIMNHLEVWVKEYEKKVEQEKTNLDEDLSEN